MGENTITHRSIDAKRPALYRLHFYYFTAKLCSRQNSELEYENFFSFNDKSSTDYSALCAAALYDNPWQTEIARSLATQFTDPV